MPLHELDWQRTNQPILSAFTTSESWCRVTLYSPTVVRAAGAYRMWYLGNSTATRTNDMDVGYAESPDGMHWVPHPGNPILTARDLPWGTAWQTPHVVWDARGGWFRMWFIMASSERDEVNQLVSFGQKLGHARSRDGITWDVHPEPVYPTGRGPCVLPDGQGYRMWMNSMPAPTGDFADLVSAIYHFTSPDGIRWSRDPTPVVAATDGLRSTIYPFVLRTEDGYTMWYGCHVDGGRFEIYCSTSADGTDWVHHGHAPAFPATRHPSDFDGRYTSTPCVVDDGDRYLLYYSARDWGNLYGAGDGTIGIDGSGIYRHIGLAIGPKP